MKAIKLIYMLALAVILFSFIAPGGEHFEISVNGTRVIRYLVYEKKPIEWLTLEKGSTSGDVSVLYNHCGQISKGRQLAVVDDKNSILKEWKFEDTSNVNKGIMYVELREITSLLAKATSQLNLFYSSEDLPNGRVLAHLKLEGMKVAKVK